MLNKFLKIFSKQPATETTQEPPKDEVLASVRYSIKKGSSDVIIDIELQDYDETSASGLCSILDILCEDFCYAETINMIRVALIQDDQEELLFKIFTHISQEARDKILKTYKDSKKDEPCVKPSDMLK